MGRELEKMEVEFDENKEILKDKEVDDGESSEKGNDVEQNVDNVEMREEIQNENNNKSREVGDVAAAEQNEQGEAIDTEMNAVAENEMPTETSKKYSTTIPKYSETHSMEDAEALKRKKKKKKKKKKKAEQKAMAK